MLCGGQGLRLLWKARLWPSHGGDYVTVIRHREVTRGLQVGSVLVLGPSFLPATLSRGIFRQNLSYFRRR